MNGDILALEGPTFLVFSEREDKFIIKGNSIQVWLLYLKQLLFRRFARHTALNITAVIVGRPMTFE